MNTGNTVNTVNTVNPRNIKPNDLVKCNYQEYIDLFKVIAVADTGVYIELNKKFLFIKTTKILEWYSRSQNPEYFL